MLGALMRRCRLSWQNIVLVIVEFWELGQTRMFMGPGIEGIPGIINKLTLIFFSSAGEG